MAFWIQNKLEFPPVEAADKDGLLGVGGDLKPERLLLAYESGIFPWSDDPVLWFSPNPRMIMDLDNYKPSKSLKRVLKSGKFTITFDTVFEKVMTECSIIRNETWITANFIKSYTLLFQQGFAHSAEVWLEDELVGGLYGLSIGSAFFGESMFHKETDASKVAFYHLVQKIKEWNFTLLDCQISNPHLISLGGINVSRSDYMEMLKEALKHETQKGLWT